MTRVADIEAKPATAAPLRLATVAWIACVAVACAVGLLLVFRSNDAWFTVPIGYIDPWVYVGFGLYWTDPTYLVQYYKASRVPWIATIWLLFKWFGISKGQYALAAGYFAATYGLNFLFLRRMFSQNIALICASAMLFWGFHHATGGIYYHNTMSGPLFAAASYATLRVAQDGVRPVWIAIPGILFLTLVVTNPIYANLAPVMVALFVLGATQRGDLSVRKILIGGLFAVLGGILAYVAFGLINHAIGRSFFFTAQLLQTTRSLVASNVWAEGWGPWMTYRNAAYFGALLGMGATSVLELATARDRRYVTVHALYVFYLLYWAFWQSMGQTALDRDFFAYPLFALWWWAAAATLARAAGGWLDTRPISLVGAAAAAFALIAAALWTSWGATLFDGISLWVLRAGIIFFGLFAILSGIGRFSQAAAAAFFLIVFPLANAAATPWRLVDCRETIDPLIAEAVSSLQITAYAGNPLFGRIWYDEQEERPRVTSSCKYGPSMSNIGYSLVSLGHSYLGDPFPIKPINELPDSLLRPMAAPGLTIAIVTNNQGNVETMISRFATYGLKLSVKTHVQFDTPKLRFTLYILQP